MTIPGHPCCSVIEGRTGQECSSYGTEGELVMPAKVTLKIVDGGLQGREFDFSERTTCIIGRHKECFPQLPDDEQHNTVSRRHCLLDINPPDIRVRDFGSRNGTHVNGVNIGQRPEGTTAQEGAKLKYTDRDLTHGDRIKLGNTEFQVEVFVPLVCSQCSSEIPEEQRSASKVAPGVACCETCRDKLATMSEPAKPRGRVCAQCGKDVSGEGGQNRPGEVVCAACQGDPFQAMRRLVQLARSQPKEFPGILGYRIVKELSRGGMGAVALARHERTGDQVALKVMLPKIAVSEKGKQSFLRETETTKALRHPNVVRLHDSGCSNGTFYFTLEFCDGGSVDKLMQKQGGVLPIDEAVSITIEALKGLEYAHEAEVPVRMESGASTVSRGLVHRDLKPHNLFLCGNGSSRVVKVGDFGLAKAFDTAGLSGYTRTGAVGGTLGFMPRQQIVNFKYAKPEVDVWSMAASLYAMLTGKTPRTFPPGQDPSDVILNTSALPIRQRNSRIPPKLGDVIDAALVDQPQIGIKTAVELRRALEGAV